MLIDDCELYYTLLLALYNVLSILYRRKKKCVRTLGLDDGDISDSDDCCNLSSVAGSHTTDADSQGSPAPHSDLFGGAKLELRGGGGALVSPLLAPATPPSIGLLSPARRLLGNSPSLSGRDPLTSSSLLLAT